MEEIPLALYLMDKTAKTAKTPCRRTRLPIPLWTKLPKAPKPRPVACELCRPDIGMPEKETDRDW